MKRHVIAIAAVLSLAAAVAAAQEDSVGLRTFEVRPTYDIPVFESGSYFSSGGTVDLNLRTGRSGSSGFFLGGLTYAFVPVQSDDSLSILTGRLGFILRIPASTPVAIELEGSGGYFLGALNDFSEFSWNPYAAGGATLRFAPSSQFEISAGAMYRSYFGLYQGLSVALGLRFGTNRAPVTGLRTQIEGAPATAPEPLTTSPEAASPAPAVALQLGVPVIDPIFPVFYTNYEDNPLGSIEVTNVGDQPVSDIVTSVYIRQYMDNAKRAEYAEELAPGKSATLDLFALFTENVLSITEGTRSSAEITVSYTVNGELKESTVVETARFLNRNAMTWSDDRHAAAFVTTRDPSVLEFSKNLVGLVRDNNLGSLNQSLQTAMALHEALDLYGLRYVPDPTTPYIEFSNRSDAVDFLQFPRQTLQYRAGDCDDLSILYSALLESVGEHTAFVTTPGHIYVAVDTGLTPAEAVDSFMPADQIIVRDGSAWIPVEITLRNEGFLRAWEQGARQWNEALLQGRAGFYPVDEAWSAYEPVGLPGVGTAVQAPADNEVIGRYIEERTEYIDRSIYPVVSDLQSRILSTGNMRARNRLGVLYATYGQLEDATVAFNQVLEIQADYVPAIMNLGNIAYLNRDWLTAQTYFERVQELRPDDPEVVLAIARVNQELQNYGNVERAYTRLRELDRGLAQQYAYLGAGADADTSRGSDVLEQRSHVRWNEE